MKNSIKQIAEKFIINLEKYLSGDGEIRIDELENERLEKSGNCAAEMISAYVELLGDFMLAGKLGRKEENYVVVRKNDMRRIQIDNIVF